MYVCKTHLFYILYRAVDGAINSDVMAAVYAEKTFLLEAARSGDFNCMAVCMYEGKGTYLGTLLRSTTILC